jgi:NAD(P)-dependent dehydrogenase (short-subunit alcohol dehydrogenase family)
VAVEELAGRVAVVTGAASGIGRGVAAESLIEQSGVLSGWLVVMVLDVALRQRGKAVGLARRLIARSRRSNVEGGAAESDHRGGDLVNAGIFACWGVYSSAKPRVRASTPAMAAS